MWLRAAALLAAAFSGQMCVALELRYISHLSLHDPEIGLTEPSGIAVDSDGTGFWIVSDETQTVFRLGLNGDLEAFTGHEARLRDLEGVAVDDVNKRLVLASERTASILLVSLAPPHRITAIELAALPGSDRLQDLLDDPRNGLEGVAVDPKTGAKLLIKETAPSLLIEIAPGLDQVVSVRDLDALFTDGEDASGLTIDPVRGGLWILSDTGKAVRFVPEADAPPINIPLTWDDGGRIRRLDNPEGVALSPDGQSLFVVTDDGRKSKLVQYMIEGLMP